MVTSSDHDITQLLLEWRAGRAEALDELMRLLYAVLKKIAVRKLRMEKPGSTLTPTVVVNEAYLRLIQQDTTWQNRSHFLSIAATVMRRVLLDYRRKRSAECRPPRELRVTLTKDLAGPPEKGVDYLALHEALERLGRLDPELVKLVELRWFAGMELTEIAEAVGISLATVKRHLTFATSWLKGELEGGGASEKI